MKFLKNNFKKIWLFLLFAFPFLSALVIHTLFRFQEIILYCVSYEEFKKMLGEAGIGLIWSIITIPFLYYFSYKKLGVTLLMISTFFSCVGIIQSIANSGAFFAISKISDIIQSQSRKSLLITAFFSSAIHIILNSLWIICCIELRKYNLATSFKKVLNNEKYQHLFQALDGFDNSKNLTNFYYESIKKHPEIEKFLSKKYYQKRKEFLSKN